MSKRTFYRTVITVEVLSEGPFHFGNLAQVSNEIDFGSCSGRVTTTVSRPLSHAEFLQECDDHGTDPEFFLGDEGKECPNCGASHVHCAECDKEFPHGTASCDDEGCIEANAPLDCDCGVTAYENGVILDGETFFPYESD